MIWFVILGVVFFVPFCIFTFNLRRQNTALALVFGLLAAGLGIVAMASMKASCDLPEGYEKQVVYEITEEGVLREANTTYYLDEHGDFYVETNTEDAVSRITLKPFAKREFEKVDAPVFKNGNFVTGDVDEVVSSGKHCTECSEKVDTDDKFCSDCGTEIK